MHSTPRIASAITHYLALGLLTSAAVAQTEVGAPTRFSLPEHVVHDIDPEETLWASGHTYKASASADGFQYVPFLGSDAPRNFPVALRVERVEVGGRALPLASEARVTRSADTWTLDRGPVDVLYELAPASVEQVVIIDDVSAGGEVRVSFTAESELEQSPEGGGFRFSGSHGDVHYGAAIAIAPDGRTCDVVAESTTSGFDLVVSASFVSTVDGALVIDPVITTGTISAGGLDTVSVDMASDPDVGFVAAIESQFSVSDHDVFLYTIPITGHSTAGTFLSVVDITTLTWRDPSIAGRNQGDELLTVASRHVGTGRRIFGRETDGVTGVAEPQFQISLGLEAYSPDVGADRAVSFTTSNRWLVCWEEVAAGGDLDVRCQYVDTDGRLFLSFRPGASAGDQHSPAISETAGPPGGPATQRFTIAWLDDAPVLGSNLIVHQRDHAGNPVTAAHVAVPAALISNVDVAGPSTDTMPNGENPYLLVYETRPLIGNGRWVRATVGAGLATYETTSVSNMVDFRRDDLQQAPVVACDGDQFMIAYEERTSLGGASNVIFCSGDVADTSFGLAERRGSLAQFAADEARPSIVTQWEGGATSGQVGFAAWVNDGGTTSAEGASLISTSSKVCGYQYCEANLNSTGRPAWIAAYGENDTTSLKRIQVSDAPANSPCYILTAQAEGFVPLVAGSRGNLCLGGLNFGRFSNFVAPTSATGVYDLVFSPQVIAQPNGSAAAMIGETWYFQGWFRDFVTVPTSNLTNGVAIPFR